MDGAVYNFHLVCPLCTDAVLTVKHVLALCNALSDVWVNCGLANPNDDTDIKYILGNSTMDFEKIFKFLIEIDILDEL